MSILVKGMDMPKGNSTLNVLIYSDGRIFTGHKDDNEYSAVEVPTPHGRLIDAVALKVGMYHEVFETDSKLQRWDSGCWVRYKMFENHMDNAPTIIEAEELHKLYKV